MATAIDTSESAILSRAIDPLQGNLTPELAEHVLKLRLTDADKKAAKEFADLAKAGTITDDQQVELDNYRRAGRVLELLKSKARLALKTTESSS